MKSTALGFVAVLASPLLPSIWASDDAMDRLREALAFQTKDGQISGQFSGTLDLEGFAFRQPSPAYFDEEGYALFNPRLSLFLDCQIGPHIYGFVQARVDRGFDPAPEPLEARLDEYALRFSDSSDAHLNLQIGQFATIVGNWAPRHLSWDNPFISAPLAYENVTGIWDSAPAIDAATLLSWAGLIPNPFNGETEIDKYQSLPVLWGPSYGTGVMVSARPGPWLLSLEFKNTPLSSRPSSWPATKIGWENPTWSARVAYKPSPKWEWGASASSGVYLLPSAFRFLPTGSKPGDYIQQTLGLDVSYAWHHWQFWAETFYSRFKSFGIEDVTTLASYVEARTRLSPRWSFSARLNHQTFSSLTVADGSRMPWGREIWRLDLAPAVRLNAHTQLKLQYSLQNEAKRDYTLSHIGAVQLTFRF